MRTWARWREARGLRPLPNSVSRRTLVQAPTARASLLVKCWWVEWLSRSQKPSHLTDLEGEMVVLSSEIGPKKRGHLSLGECQWMRSVLLTEKERLSAFALLEITLYMCCKILTFVW